MEAIIVMLSSSIAGGIGWWLGAKFGLFGEFMISMIFTAAGVYLGRRFVREYLP